MNAFLQDPVVQAVAGALLLIVGVGIIYRAMVQRDKERGR